MLKISFASYVIAAKSGDNLLHLRPKLSSEGLAFVEIQYSRKAAIWAAAGSVDTDLSFLSFLELYGTEIAERRMPARRVVEALDVVEHI